MALDSYSALKAAVTEWLEDSSGAHADSLGDFVTLGEAILFRRLRVRAMNTTTSGTLTGGIATLALPDRFAGITRLELTVGGGTVTPSQVTPEKAVELYGFAGSGIPEAFTVEGDNLRFYPTPDSDYAYAIAYRQKPQALSDSNTSNWLLVAAPDAYLYAALVAAAGKIGSEKLQAWATLLSEAVDALEAESIMDGTTGQTKTLRSRGTP